MADAWTSTRLPRIWAAVEALVVAPWKAPEDAQATHTLSRPAPRLSTRSWRTGSGPVGGGRSRPRSPRPSPATTRTCWRPGSRPGRPRGGSGSTTGGRHTGDDGWAGTSQLEVTGDTLDLTCFHDLVCDQAAQLKALGDTDTLEVRKAKAVGVIANRQAPSTRPVSSAADEE